jgi:hypothetical protein
MPRREPRADAGRRTPRRPIPSWLGFVLFGVGLIVAAFLMMIFLGVTNLEPLRRTGGFIAFALPVGGFLVLVGLGVLVRDAVRNAVRRRRG